MLAANNVEEANRQSEIDNKYFTTLRDRLYKLNSIDSDIANRNYQLDLAIAEGRAAGRDVSDLEKTKKTLNSPEFRKSQTRAIYAARGSKLRSTTEQMLLDNQKLVAKAIEKLNDSTMKLILKVMS